MSKLTERETRRKNVVGKMVDPSETKIESRSRSKEEREIKKRVSLSLRPSIYKGLQKVAYIQRRSVSELVEMMMEQYISDHENDVLEYEKV